MELGSKAVGRDGPASPLCRMRAVSSGGERFVDTEEVTGSNPVLPILAPGQGVKPPDYPLHLPGSKTLKPPRRGPC